MSGLLLKTKVYTVNYTKLIMYTQMGTWRIETRPQLVSSVDTCLTFTFLHIFHNIFCYLIIFVFMFCMLHSCFDDIIYRQALMFSSFCEGCNKLNTYTSISLHVKLSIVIWLGHACIARAFEEIYVIRGNLGNKIHPFYIARY